MDRTLSQEDVESYMKYREDQEKEAERIKKTRTGSLNSQSSQVSQNSGPNPYLANSNTNSKQTSEKSGNKSLRIIPEEVQYQLVDLYNHSFIDIEEITENSNDGDTQNRLRADSLGVMKSDWDFHFPTVETMPNSSKNSDRSEIYEDFIEVDASDLLKMHTPSKSLKPEEFRLHTTEELIQIIGKFFNKKEALNSNSNSRGAKISLTSPPKYMKELFSLLVKQTLKKGLPFQL